MEIRKEIPKHQRRGVVFQYPELRRLKPGECAVYDSAFAPSVRASVAYLRRNDGLPLQTTIDKEAKEIKVWLSTTKE